MSDIIHLLPDSIANQIAAGEVIQRPASVVKELVENAIDAGSTRIRINIKDAGRTLIQVIDDGKGMSETDARMAFERHATSKIKTADDLFALHTMGFRGEALASVNAVAQVELKTRMQEAELGTWLRFNGSSLEKSEAVVCEKGSSFSVKNLFFNVPARRKFLKTNETEFRNIMNEFERIALVNPQVSLSLYHNDAEIYNLPESGLRQRIVTVYGKSMNQKLISIDAQSSLVTVSGFIGRPDTAKKRGALQYFFVNGRFMKHPYFHKAVMQAYEQLIPAGEQPNYFIYFTLDPASIDVNIHPTKTEIKFENERPIWQILMAAAREALAKSSAIPTIDFNADQSIDIPVYNPVQKQETYEAPAIRVNSAYNPFDATVEKAPEFDWSKLYNDFESERMQFESTSGSALPDAGQSPAVTDSSLGSDLFDLSADELLKAETASHSLQYRNRYIITTLKSGLALIDQYRAHMRILFDQYMMQIAQKQGASQQLLFPELIELTPAEAQIMPSLISDLAYMGFDLNHLGNTSYSVNGLPAGLSVDAVSLLHDILHKVMEEENDSPEDVSRNLALSLAKQAAIKPGKLLSDDEIENLLASLFSTTDSFLTPDGKNIISILSDDELIRRFS